MLGGAFTIVAVVLTAYTDLLIGKEWPMNFTTHLKLIGISSATGTLLFASSIVAGLVASACPAP